MNRESLDPQQHLHSPSTLVPEWLVTGLVSILVQISTAWIASLIGILLMLWRYKEFFMRSLFAKGIVPILYENQLKKEGVFNFPYAQKIIDSTLKQTTGSSVRAVVLVLEGNQSNDTDFLSAYELALYIRVKAERLNVNVVSFLRNKVNTSGYIIACSGTAISIAPTTQLSISCTHGVEELVRNLRPRRAEALRVHVTEEQRGNKTFVGRDALQMGLVDRVGSYMEFILTQLQAEPVAADEAQLYGFVNHQTRPNRRTSGEI